MKLRHSFFLSGIALSLSLGLTAFLPNAITATHAAESDDWTIVSADKNITKTSLSNGVSFSFGKAEWGARVRKMTSPDLDQGFAFDFNASNFTHTSGTTRIGFYFSSNANAYLPENDDSGNLAAFTLVTTGYGQDRLGPGYPRHTLPPVDGINVNYCRSYTTANGNTKYTGPTGDGTVVFNHNNDNTASIHFAFKDAGNNRFSVTMSPNSGYSAHAVQTVPEVVYMPGTYFNADSSAHTYLFVFAITDDSTAPVVSITNFENLVNKHSVTFETNGGSAVQARSITDGQPVGEATTTRTGYTFGGWYSDSTFQNAWDVLTNPVTSDLVLYAKWNIETHTVTVPNATYCKETFLSLNADATGTKYPSGSAFNYNATVYLFVTLNDDTIQYTYAPQADWTKVGNTRTYFIASAVITEDIQVGQLTAIRTTNTYQVTFDTNGGSSIATQTVQYGAKATRPSANPTKQTTSTTIYTFDNWYADSELTTLYEFNNIVTGNITIYAKWFEKSVILDNVEKFCNNYMHPEIPFTDHSKTTNCLGTNGYYAKAKAAFNNLGSSEKSLFNSDAQFSDFKARLTSWAEANGEIFNGTAFIANQQLIALQFVGDSANSLNVALVVLSLVTPAALITGLFIIRKKKHNK